MIDSTFREKKDKKDVFKEELEIMKEIETEASLELTNNCTSFGSLQKYYK